MPRENRLEVESEQSKAVIRERQLEIVKALYPDDLTPQEVGQEALKLLMADFKGALTPPLESSEKVFLISLTKKYTADAPKAITVETRTSPEEMLYEALANEERLVNEAVEKAEEFGKAADEKAKLVEEFENKKE